MISVNDVKKMYTVGNVEVKALRGVNLTVEKGEFLSIAGPSGSGKTTLLNLIGCLDKCTEGEILIKAEPISKKSKDELALFRRKNLGFVFQTFNLIPVLTVFENVSFALSLLGMEKNQIREKTMRILNEVGLADLANRFPMEISGGQQQRVAIARALVKGPQIVLADEPTANLDSKTGKEILNLMEKLNKDHGTVFIFSTHDQMVMDQAHRLVLLHDGEIVNDKRR